MIKLFEEYIFNNKKVKNVKRYNFGEQTRYTFQYVNDDYDAIILDKEDDFSDYFTIIK